MRNNRNKELLFKKCNGNASYLISLDNMIWYPYMHKDIHATKIGMMYEY